METNLKKQVNHAFGKDIYLLGQDAYGQNYWLEAPSWDCGWYWGFGYVETYANNRNPQRSKDISSHRHIDGSFMGNVNGKYVHNIYECPIFVNTTFTEAEGWILSELFKTFYSLKESAQMFGMGGSHIATNPLNDIIKNEEYVKHINTVLIPAITKKILQILTPDNDTATD